MTYAEAIGWITDELCLTVDDNFDLHIDLDTDDVDLQRLAVLINFLLEKVRRNIAGHRALEQSLEMTIAERTQRLDLVVAGSNDGVWVWDLESDAAEYSDRWRAIAGLSERDIAPTLDAWLKRVHPQDIDSLRAAIRRHLEGLSTNVEASYRLRHGSGVYRWMWCRGLCLRDDSGRPKMMAGTQSDITHMRSVDAQTGLPNERYLEEQLASLIEHRMAFALLLIEVTARESRITHTGPDAGHALRTAAAERITSEMPFGATLCRLHGDFFAVIMPSADTGVASGSSLCLPFCHAFNAPLRVRDRLVRASAIVGAAQHVPARHQGMEAILRDAWNALTHARRAPGGFNLLTDAQRAAAERREWLAAEISERLLERGFQAHLQPILRLDSGQLYGFEMLTRLNHPEKGLICPGEFIPVVEELGLMRELGSLLLSEALSLLQRWASDNNSPKDLVISLNISAQELAYADFADRIIETVQRASCPPEQIKFEITEGSLIDNLAVACRHLEALRDFGFGIALDDFGTGFSSLRYLHELPITTLKVDRSFVDGIESAADKRAVAKTIHGLAGLIGADVIAEGIENAAQVEHLSTIGIGLGQGFLFARPLPPEAIATFMESISKRK